MDSLPVAAYERAERLMAHNRSRLALGTSVRPNWIGDGETFWYRVETERGAEFVHVDPALRRRAPAFDPEPLAAALGAAVGTPVDPYRLPLRALRFTADGIRFEAAGAAWRCRLADYALEREPVAPASPIEVVAPDGRWVAFRRGHDLWVRPTGGGEAFALTTDGTADQPYACAPDAGVARRILRRFGISEAPTVAVWSPDSTRILTHRVDQRGVAPMPLIEAAPPDGGRPRLHTSRYALPGETLPEAEWVVLDVRQPSAIPVSGGRFPISYKSPITAKRAWWAPDGATAYALVQSRDFRTLRLLAVDAARGSARVLIEESGRTRVEPVQEQGQRPLVRVLPGGRQALWYSQRDGWGHLYLYDLESGQPLRQVTAGAFAVQEIVHVDAAGRTAYLLVSGQVREDPYRRTLVRVGLDGGALERLSDDDLDHQVTAPPHGRWFVDTASSVDTPPVTTVRDREGAPVMEIERADVRRLLAAGWTPPERFRALADDGVTPIYGVLHKPYGFDPSKRYPVVDHIYPGPQVRRVSPWFDMGRWPCLAESVAALGFVVIALDGRGSPGRDKAFHDHSYGNLGSCGALEDHVAVLPQLAASRPWMDLDRVGMFGHSGGGFATARAMLLYPDVYRVGVAESGNHDNRFYHASWAEAYDGRLDEDAESHLSNTGLAERLKGKLLLIHGEMDDNVTPHLTMRLVDRLIAANRDFDLLIVPGAEHGLVGYEAYTTRRNWDYLVRHLLRLEPPAYRIADVPLSDEALERALT